jgi:molybdopterin-guanine dinucleotide biosynthesis protein A
MYPGCGSIAGLHSALVHSSTAHAFVTACDLPFVDAATIRHLCTVRLEDYDAVVPFNDGGLEPLHAIYSTACKGLFEKAIQQGERKIVTLLGQMNIRQVTGDELQDAVGLTSSFLNVNTPEEYEVIRTVR